MRSRILLVLWLFGALVILSGRIVGEEPAQEPDAATRAKISQRDQLWKQAIGVANAGKFDEATRLLEQAYTLDESIFGPVHEKLLRTLEMLARVAALQQDQQAVIDIRERQQRITEQLHGKSDYWTQDAQRAIADAQQNATRSANDQARLQQAKKLELDQDKFNSEGKYAAAIPLAEKVAEIRKAVHGEQHPDYATSLNNLAYLYDSMGDYPRAEPLYVQATEIWMAVLGEQHPLVATSLNNLASLYQSMGDYQRAEPLYVQAMGIRKAVLGEQHPSYATNLNNLAMLYRSMGDYPRAETLFVQAMEIRKAVLGEQHPYYAASLNNLAKLYYSMGDSPRAEPLYAQAMDISLRSLEQTASVQTESQQIAMSHSLRYQLDNSINCGLAMDPQPQAFIRQVTAWKGSVFVRLRGLRLAAADPAIEDTFRSLQSVTQRLSSLSGAIPAAEKRDAWQAQVAELNRQKEILDAQLMRDSVAFRSAQQQVTLDEVREAIPSGGAIVNYLEYNNGEEGRGLAAMVVRRDSDPVMVRLGSAADAGNAIGQWRETLGADDAARQAGVRLRRQLWEPLLPHLGDASLIFVSTDGVLGQLPFVALPGKAAGSFLIEDHALVMLPVPRLLPQLMQREQGRRLKPGHQLAVRGLLDRSCGRQC